MKNKCKAIVFDWNGTLLADVAYTWHATNHTLKYLGYKPVTLDLYRELCTVPIANMYRAFGCDIDELTKRSDEIHNIWNRVYNAKAHKSRLRRGARKLLHYLQEQNHRVVILSNHTVQNISGHTKRLGIHHHLDDILANDYFGAAFIRRGKGKRLESYLQQHKIEESIIVGDTEEEVEIARTHGLVSVAIAHGVCSTKRLRAAKPDFLISCLEEIPEISHRVFGKSLRRTG